MLRRTRYQEGCLYREERKRGSDVWIFRWRQNQPDGKRTQRKKLIGTTEQYPTESAAWKCVSALLRDINHDTPQTMASVLTVAELVKHYRLKELSDENHEQRSAGTKESYGCYLKNWVLPRWGDHRLTQVKSVDVRDWLASIKRANGTKVKIRNIMSAIFQHAMLYEWADRNPIRVVRQSGKRQRIPQPLELAEMQALIGALQLSHRTAVLLDACTGLRRSELFALQWQDVDFDNLQLNVYKSIYHQVVGRCKTEASAKPVPLDEYTAQDLRAWREKSAYNRPTDWVFASPLMKGKQPLWPDSLMQDHIKPVARRVGITKPIGWHTFRHTFSTLLRANKEDVKVVQELLRHASIRTTLDVYTQAVSSAKREAQNRLAGMIVPGSQVQQNKGDQSQNSGGGPVVPLSCPNEVSHEVPYIQ